MRRVVWGVLAGVLGAVVGWAGAAGDERERAVVERAVDGDTLEVRVRGRVETIRVLGVDTPETHDPRRPVGCFGPEAADYTARRLTGATVELEDDAETRDRYGRRLAYLWVDGHLYEDELLSNGYARLLVITPNTEHARHLLRLELSARRARRGLWSACGAAQ